MFTVIQRWTRVVAGAVTTEVAVDFGDETLPQLPLSDPLMLVFRGGLYVALLVVGLVHGVLAVFAHRVGHLGADGGAVATQLLGVPGLGLPATPVSVGLCAGCLIVSILLHEFGHVVAHRVNDIRVYRVGTELLLVVPFRFFTSYDTRDWDALRPRERAAVESAGIVTNLAVAMVTFVMFAWSGLQLLSWMYVCNVVLAFVSAIPLSGTDGDRLFFYAVGERFGAWGVPDSVRALVGVSSWCLVVGSVAVTAGGVTGLAPLVSNVP